MRRAAAGVAFATLLLSACAAQIEGPDRHVPASGTTLTYDCDDDKVLTATFEGLETVTIDHGGERSQLQGVLSGSGAKYKTGTTIFHMEDSSALLETAGGATHCIVRS